MPVVSNPAKAPIPGSADGEPWIQTFTGLVFRPLSPRIEDICIEDIAHGLSHICRFAGHVRKFYSVAEHSVRVSLEAERLGGQAFALEGLLHDATEAYLVDMPSPIKRTPELAGYRRLEENLRSKIGCRFRIPPVDSPVVHQADLALLATEARDLLGPAPRTWQVRPEPLPEPIHAWSPGAARNFFLARYAELLGKDTRQAIGACGLCHGPIRLGGVPLVRGFWSSACGACRGDLYVAGSWT